MKVKTRIILTVLSALLCIGALKAYDLRYSPITGVATAAQMDDTVSSYVTAKAVRESVIEVMIVGIWILFAFAIWIAPLVNLIRRERYGSLVIFAGLLSVMTSCAPVKIIDYVDIKSNETAWAIPLDAMSREGQVKFNSVAFLNQKKVPMKRIMIDKVPRKTGRFYWDVEWIPSVNVITVDRSLVTREWTSNSKKEVKQGIDVVTQDSVGLEVGLTITASIDEDEASTYLYYHGARPLAQVLDENVRSYAVSELTREYSNRDLTAAQKDGDTIYKDLFTSASAMFKAKGVTIQYLGNQGGLEYKSERVQASINERYIAEQDALTAIQQQKAQGTRNATAVFMAQAEADKANKLAQAKEAVSFQTDNQVRLLNAQANFEISKRWSGHMPANILPSNSPLLMNLGSK